MELGGLRALALDLNFSAHGVPATVTPSDVHIAIETRGIWVTPSTEFGGFELQRAEPKRIMALRRDVVPHVPRGAAIVAPEREGGPLKAWRVDGTDRIDADKVHVVVVLDADAQLLLES